MEQARKGAVRGELQTKAFILYVLKHFDDAVSPETLVDLTMDYVADRLEYAASLEDLINGGLAERRGDRVAITRFGRSTIDQVENVLPAATRAYAAQDARTERAALEKGACISSNVVQRGDGWLSRLELDGGAGLSLKIDLMLPSKEIAQRAEKGWRQHAESVYRYLLAQLTENSEEGQGDQPGRHER